MLLWGQRSVSGFFDTSLSYKVGLSFTQNLVGLSFIPNLFRIVKNCCSWASSYVAVVWQTFDLQGTDRWHQRFSGRKASLCSNRFLGLYWSFFSLSFGFIRIWLYPEKASVNDSNSCTSVAFTSWFIYGNGKLSLENTLFGSLKSMHTLHFSFLFSRRRGWIANKII